MARAKRPIQINSILQRIYLDDDNGRVLDGAAAKLKFQIVARLVHSHTHIRHIVELLNADGCQRCEMSEPTHNHTIIFESARDE